MKETILLTKTFLKNSFRSSDKKKNKFGLYLFLLVYFGFVFVFLSNEALTLLESIALEKLFIQAIVLMDIVLICMQSVVSSLNMFYFSDDIEHILPFPIKTKSLYFSKLNILICSEYLFEVLFFLTPLVYFGTYMNLGYGYFIRMILFMIVLPIIVCSVISFITVRLVGLFKNLKNKDMVQYVSMIASVIIIFTVTSFTYGETGQGMTETEILDMVMNLEEITNSSGSILSGFVNIFKDFIIPENLNYLVKSSLEIIVIFLLTYIGLTYLNYKTYRRNLTINFNNGKKTSKKKLRVKLDSNKNSTLVSYVKKEFKILIRTPMFFMQCVIPTIIVPIILAMPFALNINNLEALDLPALEELKTLAATKEGLLIIIGIAQMFFLMNVNAITAISRDNNNAVVMKYIPIKLYKQCIYKIIPGMIFNIIPMIYVCLVLGFVLNFNIINIILVFLSLFLLALFNSFVLILIDIRKPKLNWDSETTVVKQNMNILIGYIYQILIYVTLLFITVYLGKNIIDSAIIFSCILVILIILICTYINKNDTKLFNKIF